MRPANSSPSQTTGCLFLCFNIGESKRAKDPSRVSVGNLIPEAVGDIARRLGERLLPSHHLGEQASGDGSESETVMGMAEGKPQALVPLALANHGYHVGKAGSPAHPGFGLEPFG